MSDDSLSRLRDSLQRSSSGDPSARDELEERLRELASGEYSEFLARWEEARSRGDTVPPTELCAGLPLNGSTVAELTRLVEDAHDCLTRTAPGQGGSVHLPRVPGYELLEVLGRGGMGVVYKARQLGFNRVVALKRIRAGDGAGPAELARFRVEAEAVARLRHPNIVQVHDIGDADGCPYFSMEHLEGGSLARRANAEPLAPRRAAELVEALARAMQHAHEAGVIHRDLKPSNVLLDADGTPKVADFGLAKLLDADATQTATEAVLGTACYMAPEQATGGSRDVGPAADVYGLGAILYDLLTGRPPVERGSWAEMLRQILTRDPPDPSRLRPAVDRDLEAVCLKCLRKEPNRRYASARELADDLRRWLDGKPTAARPLGWAGRLRRFARRRPFVSAAALLLLAVAAAAPVASHYLNPERVPRDNLKQLERRQRVTLIGATGGPRWSRWVLGREMSNETDGDDAFTIGTGDRHLLELMPSMPAAGYVFSAEVRHNDDHQAARVGLYFGYEAREATGGKEHYWAALTFNDHDPPRVRPGENRADLRGEWALGLARSDMPGPPALEVSFAAHGPPRSPMPWRRLKVRVTPGDVQIWCEGQSAGPKALSAVREEFEALNAYRQMRGESELHPAFPPAGGIGLFVFRASASFRHVVVEAP